MGLGNELDSGYGIGSHNGYKDQDNKSMDNGLESK